MSNDKNLPELTKAKQRIIQCISNQDARLDLFDCNITDLNDIPELVKCTHVKQLQLGHNKISDLSPLTKLTGLTELYLGNNQIKNLKPLTKLCNLVYLDLQNNKITNIDHLSNLRGLTKLNLVNNNICKLEALTQLNKLTDLYLSNNKIDNLTPLANLSKLTYLGLNNNEIENSDHLLKLRNLQALDLRHNKIQLLPSDLIKIGLEFNAMKSSIPNSIHLYGNPINTPPPEIIEQGRQAFIDWYEAQKVELNEIKVILIGDAKAGKTSLLKRLKNNNFDENEVQTDGVNIEDLTFAKCDTFSKQQDLHGLTGHFWDFGGQEIMNATHQFFLTRRSVYILVLDARKDGNVAGQIREWLKRVNATGGDSSIIVVANQIDVNPGFGFSGEFELKNEFPQIKAFIKTSCKTEQGLNEIKNALSEHLPKAELFHTEIDKRWMEIKEKLQKFTKRHYFLNEQKFVDICNGCELTEKRMQDNAIAFLHDLGILLHFEEVRLAEYYVLDPYWITFGVYQILTSKRAGEKLGHVSVNDLDFIVNEEEDKTQIYQPKDYKKISYTSAQRLFLLDILCSFKLCFKVEKSEPTEFILPDLLNTNEPLEYTQAIRDDKSKISLVYQYSYLPKSILVNAMVDLHSRISHRWRTGFVLINEHAQALISVYDQQLTIHITGKGQQKRELMSVIRHSVDDANKVLTDKPELLIPLPNIKAYAKYNVLIKMEQKGLAEYDIYEPIEATYNIAKLLAGVRITNPMQAMHDDIKSIKKRVSALPELEQIEEAVKLTQKMQSEELALVFNVLDEQLQILSSSFSPQKMKEYQQLQTASTTQLKLKSAIPLFWGLSLEGEVDIKKWATEQYKKHGKEVFKKLAELTDIGKVMLK